MANEYVTTTNTIEVLGAPPSNINVTTNSIEVLGAPDTNAVVSSMYVQVLNSGNTSNAQVASMYVQVLRSITDAGGGIYTTIEGNVTISGGVTFT